jgi:predicted nucleic acid-binding protein
MTGTYIDSSLFVKSFVFEQDSPAAIEMIEAVGEPFLFSHLHEIEIPNAIRLKRFRGEITRAQETLAIRAFEADVHSGRFSRPAYDIGTVFGRAEHLSGRHSGDIGTRSLDLLHVAAALEAGCTVFASYDQRQRKCAALSGLKVIPATLPSTCMTASKMLKGKA